jgi:hypothetical protein
MKPGPYAFNHCFRRLDLNFLDTEDRAYHWRILSQRRPANVDFIGSYLISILPNEFTQRIEPEICRSITDATTDAS